MVDRLRYFMSLSFECNQGRGFPSCNLIFCLCCVNHVFPDRGKLTAAG